jgi:hypothetical protein
MVRGKWRPASLVNGTMRVSPAIDLGWRAPTETELATWQIRVSAAQGTVGDD